VLEIQLFVHQLEADMPNWSVMHPTIADKAGLHFEMAAYPSKVSAHEQPVMYSEKVRECRSLEECTFEISRHLYAARIKFLEHAKESSDGSSNQK